ncbi:MAG: site-specific integrase [Actinomycetota bacterium]|nr:site-specific integrase [Actinomycetota bacterium]
MLDLSRVVVTGPFERYSSGFLVDLVEAGYLPVARTLQLQLMAHVSRWLESEGLGPDALAGTVVERFLEARRVAGYPNHLTAKALAPLLAYLRGIGVVPPDRAPVLTGAEALLERYRVYLVGEHGLAAVTARGYVDLVRAFVTCREDADGELDLWDLTASDVLGFVLCECPRRGRSSAKLVVTALRSLLGFLHVEGLIARPLAPVVPSVANWRLAGLPRGLEHGQVHALLGSCDRSRAVGRRDYAILTVLVRLGMRRGEVAGLRLDDIDWQAGEIVVCGKGNRAERLPLPVDVGEAIVAYLRDGRPATAQGRSVFVRVKAPHRALTPGGVTQVVVSAAKRAGLGEVTAHRLRHTAATELLRAGAPLVEIGQLLGHRSELTTTIYAKVDRDRLRALARPWPGGAA